MESILNFIAEKMWLFLMAGIILPVIFLSAFVVYEITRVARSKKRKRRAEVLKRWRRMKKQKKQEKKIEKSLLIKTAHLRKKSK